MRSTATHEEYLLGCPRGREAAPVETTVRGSVLLLNSLEIELTALVSFVGFWMVFFPHVARNALVSSCGDESNRRVKICHCWRPDSTAEGEAR